LFFVFLFGLNHFGTGTAASGPSRSLLDNRSVFLLDLLIFIGLLRFRFRFRFRFNLLGAGSATTCGASGALLDDRSFFLCVFLLFIGLLRFRFRLSLLGTGTATSCTGGTLLGHGGFLRFLRFVGLIVFIGLFRFGFRFRFDLLGTGGATPCGAGGALLNPRGGFFLPSLLGFGFRFLATDSTTSVAFGGLLFDLLGRGVGVGVGFCLRFCLRFCFDLRGAGGTTRGGASGPSRRLLGSV